ncbi:MAG: CvpA family protein [Verrucomicrobiota bacterium]
MIEHLISLGALLLIFVSAQTGMKAGAFTSLNWMLSAFFSLLVAMRYWFEACLSIASVQPASLTLIAPLAFWLMFVGVLGLCVKLSDTYIDKFASTEPSIADRILGGIFGLATGLLIVPALMMSLSMVAPDCLPEYNPSRLPLAIDRAPEGFYLQLETKVAGIDAKAPGHTLLPRLENAGTSDPAKFWQ